MVKESMSACPTEDGLAGYALGLCTPEEADSVRAHLQDCPSCSSWIEDGSDADGLMNSLRQVLEEGSSAISQTSAEDSGMVPVSRMPDRPQIEGYHLHEELGRGGMGVVYLADQISTKRQVALKVLLEGPYASSKSKRRFEREVELAAQLDHPNIVSVLESGIASGRYYCSMRFVEGNRLDHFARDAGLALRERLGLFAKICQGVKHAHDRGIIHRDLKPSNILVDQEGEPQVLDFGLAKLSEADDVEDPATQLSVSGQVMGTLPYMSPEQTSGNHRDIDIRSDVYSLGVMLYELLTGQFPYKVTGRAADILRNIAETSPRRPSTIHKVIDNEVETIMLKALAKDRDRRYQNAGLLGDDLSRYLKGLPIEAKRDSGWYVTRKLLSRYRVPVGAALAFLAIAMVSTGMVLVQQTRLNEADAWKLVAVSSEDRADFVENYQDAGVAVQQRSANIAAEYVFSEVATERRNGARAAYAQAPAAFWESVDGGPLWRHGQWLEVVTNLGDPAEQSANQIALNDADMNALTPKQQYAQLCLAGELAKWSADTIDPEIRDWAEAAVQAPGEPGTIMAASWSGRMMGGEGEVASGESVFVDELTGLVFVQVPGTDSFAPGSPPDDPDALDDELTSPTPVAVEPFWMASTEVTWRAIRSFLDDPASVGCLSADQRAGIHRDVDAAQPELQDQVAIGYLSLDAARAFCAWLNDAAGEADPPRRFRLPSEVEWEHAARGGNPGRFCYGDDEGYAYLFANCNGSVDLNHTVAERMPNWYGLFDMHGGFWEWTDNRYPPELVADPEYVNTELWAYRGGARYSPAVRCRSAQRNRGESIAWNRYNSARLIMEFIEP